MKTISKIVSIPLIAMFVTVFSNTVLAQVSPDFVPTQGPSSDSETSLVPDNSGSSNDSEAGNILVPTTGGSNGDEIVTPAPEPVNTPSSIGSRSGGSRSGGIFIFPNVSTTTESATSSYTGSCPVITDYMRIGLNNNTDEVNRLQMFLKSQGYDVSTSSIFDSKTEEAVKAFQTKYLSDTMGPWKSTTPSGMVYITTKKKINDLACNTNQTLNSDEIAKINSYLLGQQNNTGTNSNASTTGTSTNPENDNTNLTGSAASSGGTGLISSFWSKIKSWFGR